MRSFLTILLSSSLFLSLSPAPSFSLAALLTQSVGVQLRVDIDVPRCPSLAGSLAPSKSAWQDAAAGKKLCRLLRLTGGSSDAEAAAIFGGDDDEGREAIPDPDQNFQEEDVRRGVRGSEVGARTKRGTPRVPSADEGPQTSHPSGEGQQGPDDEQAREEDAMRQQLLGRVLCKEAYARLGYVQSVDPQRARVIENKIVGMARSGQILKELTDTQLTRIMEGIKETRSVTHSQIKYERRSSLLDTLGLDPAYASKLGVEIEGWDSPVAEKENSLSEYSDASVPGSAPEGEAGLGELDNEGGGGYSEGAADADDDGWQSA